MDKLQVVSSLLSRRELPYWAIAPVFLAGYAAAKAVVDYKAWYALGEGQYYARVPLCMLLI
jgi:hypothetical protein